MWQIVYTWNPNLLELCCRPYAREEQKLRALHRSCTQDHFLPSMDRAALHVPSNKYIK